MAVVGQKNEEMLEHEKVQRQEVMRRRTNKALPFLGLGLVALSIAGLVSSSSSRASELETLQGQVSESQSQLAGLEAQYAADSDGLTEEALGVNLERKKNDDASAKKVLELATTWADGETYNGNRQRLVEEFGIAADGQFLTRFMTNQNCKVDSTGQQFCKIDTLGLTSKFESMSVSISRQESGTYYYTGYMVISSKSQLDDTTVERMVPIRYGVNPAGHVVDLEAYTSAFESVTSH